MTNNSLDLQLKYFYIDKRRGWMWTVVDVSGNWQYYTFYKYKDKPCEKELRKRKQYCYFEARNTFYWERM